MSYGKGEMESTGEAHQRLRARILSKGWSLRYHLSATYQNFKIPRKGEGVSINYIVCTNS